MVYLWRFFKWDFLNCISGLIWCITIIGIPYGKQCFKFAALSFAPFGKDVEYGGGIPSVIANVIWIIFLVFQWQ